VCVALWLFDVKRSFSVGLLCIVLLAPFVAINKLACSVLISTVLVCTFIVQVIYAVYSWPVCVCVIRSFSVIWLLSVTNNY